jgi:hypothetical protein
MISENRRAIRTALGLAAGILSQSFSRLVFKIERIGKTKTQDKNTRQKHKTKT